MDASIVTLGSPPTREATQYAASLAQLLAARLLPATLAEGPAGSAAPPRLAVHCPAASADGLRPLPACEASSASGALLLVLPRPPAEQLARQAQRTLQASTLPVLMVPSPAAGRMPPRRIALAAEGEPFVVAQGLRTMHALLLTLPTRLTVLHAQRPHALYSGADALHAVQSCGLALRHLTIDACDVPAPDPAAGILAGVQQVAADLLVVPVRARNRWGAGFAGSVTARVLAQSPVPVLLLPVSSPHEERQVA
ncbi:universal stress protein [Hymenobacter sp. BT523]|uniref:universal stress protein n=1 Tax=Hymenobacter sp. BT523 TaxID=2795725 RepID=UPI0018EAE376|nr:universal stress protein [Hymenobacter sp. BT523]MBJ6110384.1 universal stress protein [Hymenobacter sp. BT523]